MTARRKYDDPEYRAERARWKKYIQANGGTMCRETVCKKPTRWIAAGEPWDLAHALDGVSLLGPAHSACNRAEGAARGNRTRKQPKPSPTCPCPDCPNPYGCVGVEAVARPPRPRWQKPKPKRWEL